MALWPYAVQSAGLYLGAGLLLVAFPAVVFLCLKKKRRKDYERVPSPATPRKGENSVRPQTLVATNPIPGPPPGPAFVTTPPSIPPSMQTAKEARNDTIPQADGRGTDKRNDSLKPLLEEEACNHREGTSETQAQPPEQPAPHEQSSTEPTGGGEETAVEPVTLGGDGIAAESTTGGEEAVTKPLTPGGKGRATESTIGRRSATEVALEMDGISPKPPKERILVREAPTKTVQEGKSSEVRLLEEGRLPLVSTTRKVSLSDSRCHSFSRSIDNESLEMEHLGCLGEDEDEEVRDSLEGMKDIKSRFRSRTKTISGVGRHMEVGRKSSRDLKREALKNKLQNPSAVTNIQRGHGMNLELLSPDMEAKIRQMICSAVGAKYGGLRRATRAATTIQRAYRDYKLRETFREIQREKKEMTLQGVRGGHRPSILRRKQKGEGFQRRPTPKHRHLVGTPPRQHDTVQLEQSDSVDPSMLGGESQAELPQQEIGEEEVFAEGLSLANSAVDELRADESSLTTSSSTGGDEQSFPRRHRGRRTSVFPTGFFYSLQLRDKVAEKGSLPRRRTVSAPAVARRKMKIGINHFNRKPTKGVQYLVLEGVLEDDPQAVAEFLMGAKGLSKEKIGEFLGEISIEFNMAVLECLTEMVSMENKAIDEALRQFQLTFRMPGEAQKIDKIMQTFALKFYKRNNDGPVRSEDAAYILSFAIMMLHTSLHNPSVRNKTTKEQWLAITRGCNEGESFPEAFLLHIYDRIQKTEFTTGQDHTQEVIKMEKLITGPNAPKLAVPQRKFVFKVQVYEVKELVSRPNFKRHRRTLFVFSDIVVVCKKKGAEQHRYRQLISLLSTVPIKFDTQHYKHGVQFYSSLDRRAIFQCNCDSEAGRQLLLQKLMETIKELKDLEKERITELGTSIGTTRPWEGLRGHQLQSGAGDLLSSTEIPTRIQTTEREDFMSSAGDLAVSSSVPTNLLIRRKTKEAPRAPFLSQKRRARNKDGGPLLSVSEGD